MSGSKVAGAVIAVIGIVLVVIGIAMYVYEETVLDLYFVEVVDQPYQDLGTVMLVLGIIVLVAGIILAAISAKRPAPPA